jgi:hypothetical protein
MTEEVMLSARQTGHIGLLFREDRVRIPTVTAVLCRYSRYSSVATSKGWVSILQFVTQLQILGGNFHHEPSLATLKRFR